MEDNARIIEELGAEVVGLRQQVAQLEEREADRKRAEQELRRRAEELDALQATVLDITAQRDLDSLLETIVVRAARLLGAPGGGLYLCDLTQKQVRCVVSYNTPKDFRGTMLPYGEGASGAVAQTGEPLIIEDYRSWPGRSAVFDQEQPFRAVLAVPMLWQGQVIGILDIVDYAEDHRFTQADQELLAMFANHAAVAVENTRLYDQAQHEIARREHMEQQCKERRLYLEQVLACAPDAIIAMDAQHRIQEWNPGAEKLFGYSAKEAIGGDIDTLIAAPDATMLEQAIDLTRQALDRDPVAPTETIRYHKDGTALDVIVAGSPILIEGEVAGTVAVYTDITQRKRTEDALRENQRRYALATNAGQVGVWDWDLETGKMYLDPSLKAMLGYEDHEIRNHVDAWKRWIHPDDVEWVMAEATMHLEGHTPSLRVARRVRHRDGSIRWFLAHGTALRDTHGKAFRLVGTDSDITERKQAEEALKKAEHEKETILDSLVEHVVHQDREMRILWANRAACESVGMTRDELIGRTCHEIWAQRGTPCPDCAVLKAIRAGQPHETETTTPDGRNWYVRGYPVRNEQGEIVGGVEITLDISERQQAEYELRRLQELHQEIVHNVTEGIIVQDAEARITFINPAGARLLSYEPEELVGVHWTRFVPPDQRSIVVGADERRRYGAADRYEVDMIRKDGSRLSVLVSGSPRFDPETGDYVGTLAIVTDIGERLRTEEAIRQSEERLQQIIQQMPYPVEICGPDGTATMVNQAFLDMFGIPSANLVVGHYNVFADPVVETMDIEEDIRRVYRGETIVIPEARIPLTQIVSRYQTGRETPFFQEITMFPVMGKEGQVWQVVTIRKDITDRVQAEERLTRYTREMEALYETSLEINAQPDLSTLLQAIVRRASELVGTRMGGLYLLRPDGEALELVVSHNLPGDYVGTRLSLGEGLSGRIAQVGEPRMVADYHAWEGQADVYRNDPFRRVLGVPLKVGARILGVINVVDDERTGPFGEEAVRLVSAFADQAAIALENTRLFEAEARRRREAETLQAATQALSSTLDLRKVFELILSELQQVVPYDSATVQQIKGDQLEIIGGIGFPNLEELLGLRFHLQTRDNPNQEVIRNRQPLILEDAPAIYGEFTREPHAQADIHSWLGVPLLFGERVIGMLALDKKEPGFYTSDHARLVLAFAAQAAIAIENARLYQEAQQRLAELALLFDTSAAVSTSLEAETVLQATARQITISLEIAECSIYSWDRERDVIVNLVDYSPFQSWWKPEAPGTEYPLHNYPVSRQVLVERRPIVIQATDPEADAMELAWMIEERVETVLMVPMVVRDEPVGIMEIMQSSDQGQREFTATEVALCQTLANQAAAALENARLFEAERTAREEAEARAADLRTRERYLSTLNDITRTALETPNLRTMLQTLADRLGELLDADSCFISRWDAVRQMAIPAAASGPLRETYPMFEVKPGEATLTESAFRAGGPLVIEDPLKSPLISQRIARQFPVRSALALPLIADEQKLGAAIITYDRPHRFTPEEIRQGEQAASQVALALAKAQLLETEREQRELAEALRQATVAVSSTLDLEEILDHILEQVDRVVPNDAVNVNLVEGDRARIVRWRGYERFGQDVDSLALSLTDTNTLHRMQEAERAVFIADTTVDPTWVHLPEVAWVRSYAGAPIRVRDEVIGFLNADSAIPGFYNQDYAERLQAFADQAGLAIENARLFRETGRRVEHLVALSRIGLSITADLDLQEVLNTLYEQLAQIMDVGAFYVALYDKDSGIIDFPSLTGATGPGQIAPLHIDREPGITGHVIRSKQPLYVPDTWAIDKREDYQPIPLIKMSTRSYIGIPLFFREKVTGVLSVQSYTPDAYSQADVDLLATIASQASVAIENARLFQIVEQGKREWEATFDAMQDAVVLMDRDYQILRANRAFVNLFERPFSQIVGQRYTDVAVASLCQSEACALEQTIEDGQVHTCMHEYGSRCFELQATYLPGQIAGEADRTEGTILVLRDITERVEAEKEIHSRNQELALFNRVIGVSAASQGVEPILETVCRELAQHFCVHRCTAALFDRDKKEMIVVAEAKPEGKPSALGQVHPVESNLAAQYVLQHKAPLVAEEAQAAPHLAPIHDLLRRHETVSMLTLPVISEGEVLGILNLSTREPRTFSKDEMNLAQRVAEQVSGALTRANLEETQRRLSAAVEQAAEAIFITTTDGTILYVNPAFERVSGYSRSEAIGQNPRLLKSGEHDTEFYRDLWDTMASGRAWEGRFINRRKDGKLFTEEATITPVRNQAGEIVNFVTTMRDVTREVQLEEQFHQAQKMEALGQMAGGIAHDFNNLLTVIHLSTRLLQRQLHPEDPLWEHVQRIQETGERATRLTKQLLSFSRREVVEPELLNLNQVVEDLSRMLQRIIGEDIQLVTDLADDLWPVEMDPTQVDQVVMNLVVNARDAMPEGGTLIIQTGNVVFDDAYASSHVDVHPGEHTMLAISDTGVGMDEEIKNHLFEPFFTTKERGQGTGLGLPTVFGIVTQNGGHIEVDSQPGQGTTIAIYLPIADRTKKPQAAPSRSMTSAETKLVRGTETVLVVEDEQTVRDLAVQVLKSCGYQVLAASNGQDALRINEQHNGPIHLLLTDVVMPQMSGGELANRLQELRPEMRVLYMSGYADDTIMQRGVLTSSAAFVSKPLTIEELTRRVRAVLDGRI